MPSVCIRKAARKFPRPATLPCVGQFGDRLQMDMVSVANVLGQVFPFLGIIDLATLLHVVCLILDKSSKAMFKVFADTWPRAFGLPIKIILDLHPSFQGDFKQSCLDLGIDLEPVPPGGHYEMGAIDHHNFTCRQMAEKVIDAVAATTPDQLEIIALQTCHAKNTQFRRAGRSPSMATFGRIPRLPGALLTDEHNAHTFKEITQNEALAFSETCRIESLKAFAEVGASDQLRKSILRQTHNLAEEPPYGSRVGFWKDENKSGPRRKPGSKKSTRSPGYLVGVYCGPQPKQDGNAGVAQWPHVPD